MYQDDLTGETVSILGINGNPMPYQTATIPITLKNKTVYDTVAVAPADQLNTKVLLSTPVTNTTVDHLVDSYLSKEQNTHEDTRELLQVQQAVHINQVTRPRRIAKTPVNYFPQQEQSYSDRHEDNRASDMSYDPQSESYTSSVTDSTESEDDIARQRKVAAPNNAPLSKYSVSLPLSTQSEPSLLPNQSETSYPETIAEPQSPDNLTTAEPQSPDNLTIAEPQSPDNLTTAEPQSPDNLTIAEPSSSDTQSFREDCEPFNIPAFPVVDKASTIESLKADTRSDPTLKVLRGLAHHDKNGYTWDKGLLYHISLDPTTGEKKRLVIPKSYRDKLIQIAHDNSGHFSINKTRAILNNRFTWPNMGSDITTHILACIKCKRFNKIAHKQAPFYNRPTISEPYEEIALDLIGPLPRSKHGHKFALTAICMASRWPEVYPLPNSEAESVANALIHFIARNGIPVKILTDQGTQFMSQFMTQTCTMLGIAHVTTVPYQPQGNGVLERFHGTLKPLLAKASQDGIDWVSFLPLALSAIRSVPCRSTGFSPAELVFGKNTRNFLDVIYEGWSNPSYSSVDVVSWVQQLNDKLELLRDTATFTNQVARS